MNCDGCNGLFFRVSYQDPQRLAMVRDGTSNTFMVGEDIPEHNYHSGTYLRQQRFFQLPRPAQLLPRSPNSVPTGSISCLFGAATGAAPTSRWRMAAQRFVAETIDHGTYRALSTKAGGEVAALP